MYVVYVESTEEDGNYRYRRLPTAFMQQTQAQYIHTTYKRNLATFLLSPEEMTPPFNILLWIHSSLHEISLSPFPTCDPKLHHDLQIQLIRF